MNSTRTQRSPTAIVGFWLSVVCGICLVPNAKSFSIWEAIFSYGLMIGLALFAIGIVHELWMKKRASQVEAESSIEETD